MGPSTSKSDLTPKPSSSSPGRIAKALGFTKNYNAILFASTALVFSAYNVYRIPALDYEDGWGKKQLPGEWYYFREGLPKIGMIVHLWSVIPAGILMPLQFVPALRRRSIKLHRYLGRALIVLLLLANISALIIAPYAFGGTIATRTGVIVLAILTTTGLTKAYLGICNLRIDEHRTWMLRTWAYAGVILNIRIFLILLAVGATFLTPLGRYKYVSSCHKMSFMYTELQQPLENMLAVYPQCAKSSAANPVDVIVNATLRLGRIEQVTGIMNLSFGVAIWISIVLNGAAVEWYLCATRDEEERLKRISLLKRKEAGMVDGKKREE